VDVDAAPPERFAALLLAARLDDIFLTTLSGPGGVALPR
jgi:hypothetical protein